MTPKDKKKLQDAFNRTVERSPYADERFDNFSFNVFTLGKPEHRNGTEPQTYRELVKEVVLSERFYQDIDQSIAEGKTTIARAVSKISENTLFLEAAHRASELMDAFKTADVDTMKTLLGKTGKKPSSKTPKR